MKKITIMSIILSILLVMTTVVCAAEGVTATVTAPATVEEGTETVAVTVSLDKGIGMGDFEVKLGTANVLKYKDATVEGNGMVEPTENGGAFIMTGTTKKITLNFEVVGKAGESTTVEFVKTGVWGEDSHDNKEVTVSGKPTITIVAKPTTTPTTTQKPTEGTTTPTQKPTEGTTTPTGSEEDTPAPTEGENAVVTTSTGDDTFDQTGMNVGVVAGIALAVVIGTAVVVKRK